MSVLKLAAIDIDGTLLNSYGVLTPKTRETIEKLIKKDIIIVPASVHLIDKVPKSVFNIDGIRYFISTGGTSVYDKQEKKNIYCSFLDQDTIKKMLDIISQFRIYYEVIAHNKVFVEKGYVDQEYRFEIEIRKDKMREMGFLESVDDLPQYILEKDLKVEKIMFPFFKGMQVSGMGRQMLEIGGVNFNALGFDCLEFFKEKTSKGIALMALCRILGIDQDEVFSLGDGINDYEMIDFAGIGVAMGNACAKVKAGADFVTKDNNHDGVAFALEKYFLKGI